MLRDSNLALVAQQIFSSAEPVSRADVAAATGMTRSTASRLVDELVASRLVDELPPAAASGPGRPAVPLAPARATVAALGLEINVSRIAVRVIDLTGLVLAERIEAQDLADSDPAAALARLSALMIDTAHQAALEAERITPAPQEPESPSAPQEEAGATGSTAQGSPTLGGLRLAGAALALPGLVSAGTLLRAPNLGWSQIRPEDHLAPDLERLGVGLQVGNEADFGALAAARLRPGASGQSADFIYLSGENGIGAGLVRDGVVLQGTAGFAGEVGHIQVDPTGPACSCGNQGCLERYAGRRVILAAAGLEASASPADLVAAWQAGSPSARQAVDTAARALAVALGAAINVVDIPDVVLGGHLAPLTGLLRPLLEPELSRRVLASPWSPTRVLPAPADEYPAASGAACAVLERIIADPASWVDAQPGA